jgi:4-amino-4-deoxy-L-arabinose transferase-like glycosyltransferase
VDPLVLLVATAVVGTLLMTAGRYGYHRDELYFLAAGRHLAWGYPDQPPLIPLLARLMSAVAPHSLVALRAPSALAAGGVVVITGALARVFGADHAGRVLAAAAMATSALLLGAAHLLSTTALVLLIWPVVVLLVLRAVRDGRLWWLAAGLAAGLGLQAHVLTAALLAGILVGLAVSGPRRELTSPWPWLGVLVALAVWAPYVAWQAAHGWPQVALARSIAAGHSGSSQSRLGFVLTQPGLLGVFAAPIWVSGIVRLWRDARLRWARWVAATYGVLAVAFVVAGGKGYYLGGLYPALLAAGAAPTMTWLRRRTRGARAVLVAAALALGVLPAALLVLPLIPVRALHRTPLVSINYDAGETVGWPAFVADLADVAHRVPADLRSTTVVLAANYGEAGAAERFGPALGLPPAYSGHNGFWLWGPPPDSVDSVIAVGFRRTDLETLFREIRAQGHIDNGLGVRNAEQGAEIWFCRGVRRPWPELWHRLKNYG